MARLTVIDPATATGKAKQLFDGPLKEKQLNIFKGMANNPKVFQAVLNFMGGIKGELTPAEHELLALEIGTLNDCKYCQAAHSMAAAGVGLSSEVIEKAKNCQSDDPKEAALLSFTKAVMDKKGFVTDEELNNFKAAGYNDAAVVEVIAAIAVNTFTNLFNHVNDTEIDAVFQPAGTSA